MRGHPLHPHIGTGRHCCKREYRRHKHDDPLSYQQPKLSERNVLSVPERVFNKSGANSFLDDFGDPTLQIFQEVERSNVNKRGFICIFAPNVWRSCGFWVKGSSPSTSVDSEVPANMTRLNTWLWLLMHCWSFNSGLQACKTENVHGRCKWRKVYLVHSALRQQNDLTLREVTNYIRLKLHTVQMEGFQNLSLVSVLQSFAKIIRKIKFSPIELYSIHRQNRI